MSSLGDALSGDTHAKLTEGLLCPGTVIQCFIEITTPPKYKRVIIVGADADSYVAIILVNSDINPNIHKPDRTLELQVPLKNDSQKTYLDHDSYADCSELYAWERPKIESKIHNSRSRVLGRLSEEDWSQIKQTLRDASTITPKMKKRFGLFVGS